MAKGSMGVCARRALFLLEMAMQKQQHESERNGRPSVSKDKVVKNVRAIRKSCSALGTGLSHFFAKEKGAVR